MSDEGYKTSPVVGYIRSARKDDPQLDEWEAQIRAYAAEHGYNLLTVLREEAVSGVAALRPTLNQLVRDIAADRYFGIIVPAMNHLSQNRTDIERTVSAIRAAGGWLQSLT